MVLLKTKLLLKWKMGAWGRSNGYPKLCTFYQDRFVVAVTNKNPNYILDEPGLVTIQTLALKGLKVLLQTIAQLPLPVINRKMYEIRHLVPANDLIILTSGNEWIVSGDKTITPTNCNLKTKPNEGPYRCEPQFIGNRCVFVQNVGGTVRDMGYFLMRVITIQGKTSRYSLRHVLEDI